MAMASTWLMAEPSLSPLAQTSASPNMMSDPAMPGAMRTEASGAPSPVPSNSPIDAEVEAEEILGEGHSAEQHEDKADQPGNRPKAPEGQAEKPEPRGKHAGSRIRRHAVQVGKEWIERGEVEMPARKHERAHGADHNRAKARQAERHPHGARHRQSHPYWDLNHSPSSPNLAGSKPGRNWGAPRQKALKISSNERALPPCRDVIA